MLVVLALELAEHRIAVLAPRKQGLRVSRGLVETLCEAYLAASYRINPRDYRQSCLPQTISNLAHVLSFFSQYPLFPFPFLFLFFTHPTQSGPVYYSS